MASFKQNKWLVIDADSVNRGMASRVSGRYVTGNLYHDWCDLLMDLVTTTLPTHAVIVQGAAIRSDTFTEQRLIAEASEPFGISAFSSDVTDSANLVSGIVSSAQGSKRSTVEIVTSDIRCWQLISKHVVVIEPFGADTLLKRITDKTVSEQFGIVPQQLPDSLAMIGHSTMDVPGLKGIGKKTAARVLSGGRTLTDVLNDPCDVPTKFYRVISQQCDELLRWRSRLALVEGVMFDFPVSAYRRRDPDFGLLRLLVRTVGPHNRLPELRAWCDRPEPTKVTVAERPIQPRAWSGQGMLWSGDDELKNRTSRIEYDGRYKDHLKSAQWHAKWHAVMKRDNYFCKICEKARATQVHHKSYDRFGREPLIDLIAVCSQCHQTLPTSPDRDPLEFLNGAPLPKVRTIEYWTFLKRILNKWRARPHPLTLDAWRRMESQIKDLDSQIENAPYEQQVDMLLEINTLRCELAEIRALGGGLGFRGRKSGVEGQRMGLEEYWQHLEL